MKRLGHVLGRIALGALVLVLVLLGATIGTVIVGTQTQWGRDRLLRVALPRLQSLVTGRIVVGRVEGNLFRRVVLRDVAVYDMEGRLAARLARGEVTWRPLALRRHEADLREVKLEGLEVVSRPLADGRNNLAALVPPSPEEDEGPSRWRVSVGALLVEGKGEVRDAKAVLVGAHLRLHAWAEVAGGVVRLVLHSLAADTSVPAVAELQAKGAFRLEETFKIHDLKLQLRSRGEEVHRALPALDVRGPLELAAEVAGSLHELAVEMTLRPARGQVSVKGTVADVTEKLRVDATVAVRDLDPSVVRGAPTGRVTMDARADIRSRGPEAGGPPFAGDITVSRLEAVMAGARLEGRGKGNLEGELSGQVHLWARDLAAVRPLPVRLAGQLDAEAEVAQREGRWRIDARARGNRLVYEGSRVRELRLVAALDDWRGRVEVLASGLKLGGQVLDRMSVEARMGAEKGRLRLGVEGPTVAASLGVEGVLLSEGRDGRGRKAGVRPGRGSGQGQGQGQGQGGVRGFAGRIETLEIASQGRRWAMSGAAPLRIDWVRRDVALGRLRLTGAEGRLELEAKVWGGERVEARVAAREVSVNPLLALVEPDQARTLPPTHIAALDATARGPIARPVVELALRMGMEDVAVGVPFLDAGLRGRWAEGKLGVALQVRGPEHASLGLDAVVPMPLDRRKQLQGMIHLRSIAPGLLQHWMPQLRKVTGLLEGTVQLAGTLDDPVLGISLMGRDLRGMQLRSLDTTVVAAYGGRTVRLEVRAMQEARDMLHGAATVELGVANFAALREALAKGRQPQAEVAAELSVEGFELGQLRELLPRVAWPERGVLRGRVAVRGNAYRPHARADLRIVDLRLADREIEQATLKGSWDGTWLDGHAFLDAGKSGTMKVDARVGQAAEAPLEVVADLRHFDLGVVNAYLKTMRNKPVADVRGMVDAHVRVGGTRKMPAPVGSLHLKEGGFLLMADGRRYQSIVIDTKLTPEQLVIEQLRAATIDGGRLRATGKADLAPGPRLVALDTRVVAERFGIAVSGNLVGNLNGQMHITGKVGPKGLTGMVQVEKGSVRVPAFSQSKNLQSTEPLVDVVYVDERGRRRQRAQPAGEEPMPTSLELGVRLSKPLELRGPEINTDLHGQIDVQVRGEEVRLTGALETSSGWIDVFGNRFTIDHVRVGFGGGATIDPTLDIRVTRQRGDVSLAVNVSGTASKPRINLSSDPPIYNESEILALIISGDPAAQGGDRASLNDKIVGAISGLIVGQLKKYIAPQLPIDVLKVDVAGGGGGPVGVGQTRIEVGKFITPKLYLSYVHQFGQPSVLQPRNSNQATVEWRFAPRWQIEVTYGDANVGAADVFFRLRF